MKYLAIDFGLKRVGLALSDPGGKLAFPHKTIYKTSRDKLFAAIFEVVAEQNVEALIVGLPEGPVAADGEEALIVRQVRNFAQGLKRRGTLPVYLVDEYYTSQDAAQRLREAGLRGGRLKEVLDQHAAARILEAFLAQGGPDGGFETV